MNTKIIKDKKYWLRQTERYFDAEISDEEERKLRSFAASPAGNEPEFEELRAVMSFISVGKDAEKSKARPSILRLHLRTIAASAAIAVAAVAGTWITVEKLSTDDIYVAYINGKKTTDPDVVMNAMRSSVKEVMSPTDTPKMEDQLDDMFQTLNDAEETHH